ncbi:MAG: divalent-cation tolerance protein CutA [Patescibacteria group bacterium]
MNQEAILVMISCEDKGGAERIGELLLKKKLAACVQVVPHVDSMFLWPPGKNRIDYGAEGLLLVKTLESKWSALEKEVLKIHSYENPEILAIPIAQVSNKYLAWLTKELS